MARAVSFAILLLLPLLAFSKGETSIPTTGRSLAGAENTTALGESPNATVVKPAGTAAFPNARPPVRSARTKIEGKIPTEDPPVAEKTPPPAKAIPVSSKAAGYSNLNDYNNSANDLSDGLGSAANSATGFASAMSQMQSQDVADQKQLAQQEASLRSSAARLANGDYSGSPFASVQNAASSAASKDSQSAPKQGIQIDDALKNKSVAFKGGGLGAEGLAQRLPSGSLTGRSGPNRASGISARSDSTLPAGGQMAADESKAERGSSRGSSSAANGELLAGGGAAPGTEGVASSYSAPRPDPATQSLKQPEWKTLAGGESFASHGGEFNELETLIAGETGAKGSSAGAEESSIFERVSKKYRKLSPLLESVKL